MLNYKTSTIKTSKVFILPSISILLLSKKSNGFKLIFFLSFLVPLLLSAISVQWAY